MANKNILLLGFIAVKFILQYSLISSDYDLQRDEFLHLDQAHHLAWGYLSVPPVTSWISYLIFVLGNTVFWIKFFPALFGALTILVVWKTIETLNGTLFALILGASCVLFSALLRLNTLYQPNSLDVLSWTTLYFFIIKFIKTNHSKWLYLSAICFAFGFLNKYNIAFLVIGLAPALALSEHRTIFTQIRLYMAAGLGLLLILPNLIWQYTNRFPVIHHMKELTETQLIHVDQIAFLKTQLLFYPGAILVILSAFYALLFYKEFRPYRFFFFAFIFTFLAFLYFQAKDYYVIGLYPIYIAFGATFLGEVLQGGWKKQLQPVAVALPLLMFIPLFKVAFPNVSPEYIIQNPAPYKALGLLRWEDGKDHTLPQDFADMLGWKELAAKVDSVCATLPNLDKTLILCDNYGQAGAINYYTTNKNIVASSFNADYINWLRYDKEIVDVVLVKEGDDDDKARTKEVALFDTVYLATKRINSFAREPEISIYVLRGAKVDINRRIKEEADRKKTWMNSSKRAL
ncbi:glycosyltransferase family 39 protein [Arundinibacter roseus]|uniref:Glycosyltransferase family 39 protein n=1 Tax=Arundinibacter roseus TaxID=2070510 RepID=A0A4R4K8F8_9BACT|nr:glycosyltransferase family 39 protein [Arundinibacter roseus]TDB63964.1 glycosyltransferase family 39 protein [Arundinibacter roseus]